MKMRMNEREKRFREAGLSTRAVYCLMNAGLERLEDLRDWEVGDLLCVKNLGKVTLGEIICIAKREGIELKGMDKEVYKEKDDKKITTEGVLEDVFRRWTIEEVEEAGSLVLVTEINLRSGEILRLEKYRELVVELLAVLEEGLEKMKE
jgi:hypothetical protein